MRLSRGSKEDASLEIAKSYTLAAVFDGPGGKSVVILRYYFFADVVKFLFQADDVIRGGPVNGGLPAFLSYLLSSTSKYVYIECIVVLTALL